MDRALRVLVIEDSSTTRRILRQLLARATCVTQVGEAATGSEALEMLPQFKPDIVTLDIELPDTNGLQVLKMIRAQDRHLPVIMVSALAEAHAAITLRALEMGATDFVTKPNHGRTLNESMEALRHELVPKICFLGERYQRTIPEFMRINSAMSFNLGASAAPPAPPPKAQRESFRRAPKPEIVLMGSSTGGPQALRKIVSMLTPNFSTPMVIAQHMPPMFTRLLAESLNNVYYGNVVELSDGVRLRPRQIGVAPGGACTWIERHIEGHLVARVSKEREPRSPSINELFRTGATASKGRCLAVALTGMGDDGSIGAQVVRDQGGFLVAQDEASSVVWGIPGQIIERGLADRVVDLNGMSLALETLTTTPKSHVGT